LALVKGFFLVQIINILIQRTFTVRHTEKATISIMVYSDYQCSHCALANVELKKLLNANPDVRVIYKDYPLSNACNQYMDGAFHTYACEAAQCVRCAAEQGKFLEYHDLVYKNQESINEDTLQEFADQLNLDMDKFKQCTENNNYMTGIYTDIDEAASLGIAGTPTFFINGTKIEGFRPVEELQKEVDKARKIFEDQKIEMEKQKAEAQKKMEEQAKKEDQLPSLP